jgi:carbonic anhydrase
MMDELLEANRAYAAGFGLAGVPPRAARGLALVTCMDSRIEPLAMLGLAPGDAKILRNAGGRVTPDVLRSLILATHLLGVHGIVVMQHTDCALAGRTEEEIQSVLPEAVRHQMYLAMPHPDAALRRDVDLLRSSPLLPSGTEIEGWRYQVESGAVERVVQASDHGGAAAV